MPKGHSFVSPQLPILTIDKTKPRQNHTEGLKKVYHSEINDEGYTKEIGSATGETGYGDDNQNRLPGINNLDTNLHGPDGVIRDTQNWMGNMSGSPYSSYPSLGAVMHINTLTRMAVQDSFKEQLRRALSRLKENGTIPEEVSIDEVKVNIPGHGEMSIDQLSEELAKVALETLKQKESETPAKEEGVEAPEASGSPKLDMGTPFGEQPEPTGAAPDSNSPIDNALGALESAAGVSASRSWMSKKFGVSLTKDRALDKHPDIFEPQKKKTLMFNYTHPTHQERSIPEGDSKYERDTNLRDHHMDLGDGYDSPLETSEPNMGGDPMANSVRMFM